MLQKYLSKMSPREKKIFYVALVFGSAFLFDRLFMSPALKRIKATEVEIKRQEERIRQDLEFLANRDQIEKEGTHFAKYIPKKIKEKDEINTELFRTIERLAAEANVNLIKSNPGDIKEESSHIQYFASIDCSGKLNDVIGFMHLLNSTGDLFKVVQFNMSPKRGVQDEITTSMTIVKLIVKPSA